MTLIVISIHSGESFGRVRGRIVVVTDYMRQVASPRFSK